MKLKHLIKFIKGFYEWSDEQVAQYFGVSRPQITKMNAGYWEGISCQSIKRISQTCRISIDELLDNQFLPPSYHISKNIYSIYITAEKDYVEHNIQKGDYLYIRPFIYDTTKDNQLVLVRQNENYQIEKLTPETLSNKPVHFHIVGITRFLYKPIEDIEYQKRLGESEGVKKKRRGAPIKI